MSAIEYRRAVQSDYAKCVDFANLVFSAAYRPHDFKALSPKVYADPARFVSAPHYLAVEPDDSVRGMVGVLPNTLKVGRATLKTGFIGTVSVHPYARGEGHMKKLMSMALQDMRADGTDLVILSGQRQRYEYFGFTQGGMQRLWRVSQTNLRHVLGNDPGPNLVLEPATPFTSPDIMARCAALNDSRTISAARSGEDFLAIAQTRQSTLQLITLDGAFAGYLICVDHTIHEIQLTCWELLPWVLRLAMRQMNLTSVELVSGECETELNQQLSRIAERCSLTHYDMIQILNFPKVLQALLELKAAHEPLADGICSLIIGDKPLTIQIKNGVLYLANNATPDATHLTETQAQTLFLNPLGQLLTGCRLPLGWAPLPLYMSAADSF